MPDPRWTLLVHGGSSDGEACLAAARAGATVLRYGGGAMQGVEAALRSFRRGSGEDVDAPLDGLITDGRTLRTEGAPRAGEGRWGAVALDGDGHLAAGGWGDAHADDAAGAASTLGAAAAARIVQVMEEGSEPLAAVAAAGPVSVIALDRRGRTGFGLGRGALALARHGSEPRLVQAAEDDRELLDG